MVRLQRIGSWLLVLGIVLGGCSGLESKPLDPAKSEAEFLARRLDDPGLTTYLQSQGLTLRPAWTLEALTLAAFYYHPDLDIARARLMGAKGAETSAGAWANPTLNAGLEKVMGSTGPGVSPWVYGFDLQMPIDFFGAMNCLALVHELAFARDDGGVDKVRSIVIARREFHVA